MRKSALVPREHCTVCVLGGLLIFSKVLCACARISVYAPHS